MRAATRLSPRTILLLALSPMALACGGVTSAVSSDDAGVDAPTGETAHEDAPSGDMAEGRIVEACAAVAKATCNKRVSCSGKIDATGVGIVRQFGTMAECLTRQALQCLNAFRAPGSGHSLATEQECVAAFASYSCPDFFADSVPPPCQPAGSRVNGAACAFNAQCKSTFCTGEKNAVCGTCGPSPAVGASCVDSDCALGQVCDATTMTCKLLGVAGDPCDSGDDCGYALICGAATGTTGSRKCESTLSELGAACGGSMPVCDGTQGLFCAGAAGAKKCVATTFVGDGMPCGVLSQDAFAGCEAGACYTANGIAAAGEMGACKASASDGAACDTILGPGCELPARCILSGKGTAGICRVPTGNCL
ncbi:MAG TPA: hypothetical protein VMT47_00935 [Polyangia bacterium]|nr:hypothetical protein [Polyangia bacterium]